MVDLSLYNLFVQEKRAVPITLYKALKTGGGVERGHPHTGQ